MTAVPTPAETALLADSLEQASIAQHAGDHPYGAVIVTAAGTLAERNRVESTPDPTAHSEVMALRSAAARWGLESLHGATLVTSFEPCPMCFAAILEAGVRRLVIGVRRTVGEAPLGGYTVEALLRLMDRDGDIEILSAADPELRAFYA